MAKEARKVDEAARLWYNSAIGFPSASAHGREAFHSREGLPTGSETMSSVTFRGITIRRQDVLRALAEFDTALGADNSGRQESLPADDLYGTGSRWPTSAKACRRSAHVGQTPQASVSPS